MIIVVSPHNKFAIVALGSNVGDSRANVCAAFDQLEELSNGPLLRSSLWESSPVDCPPGSPVFVNAVAVFEPLPYETPESLMAKLQSIEREFGRKPKVVLNEPRPLDLDLIAFLDQVRSGRDLVLPHPRAHQRRFVLEPLNEIAPELALPGTGKSIAELLSKLSPDPGMRKLNEA